MTQARAIEAKRADACSCPRCLSVRIMESRRNPAEEVVYWTIGFVPCRCTSCMHRFIAFAGPAWLRLLAQKALGHGA
ncbi:MAG: hypothetical protein SGI92_11765 [Bryobacteraceae bacterium]|nr:hypothetical protein [Bryobacteraceae bacterium]